MKKPPSKKDGRPGGAGGRGRKSGPGGGPHINRGGKGKSKGGGKPGQDGEERKTRWKFGQNFLVDEGVIRDIVDDVPSTPGDWIVEIGPGQGALSRRLAKRCAKLTAVEIDPKWVEHLQKHPDWGNIEVIHADATRVDVADILDRHAPAKGARPLLVGNLPYNRAAPILFRFLPHIARFKSMHIMVQYEVAKRICAKPHTRNFGFLTVFIQNLAEAELVRKIGPDSFRPRPKVLSATVKLTPLAKPRTLDPHFLKFAEMAFSQKRKKLVNSLSSFYPKEQVGAALTAMGINPEVRAEDLDVPQFATLFESLGMPKGWTEAMGTGAGANEEDENEDVEGEEGEEEEE